MEDTNSGTQIYITQPKSNGMGIAGFVLSLVALIPIPFLSNLIWLLGLIFSFIGLFKEPRGFAIAGLVISLIWFVIAFLLLGVAASFLAFAL